MEGLNGNNNKTELIAMKTKMIIKDQNGAAAVEFAIILPLLIVLLFGIIEFGLLLYNKQIITNASREGARAGVVMRETRLLDADIVKVARDYAEDHLVTFGSGTLIFDDPPIFPAEPRTGTPLKANLIFTVKYPYDFLVLSAFGFGPVTLQAQTIMKRDVITLQPQDTLDKAIELLVEKKITGIPVVNEDRTLAGIITEKDILVYMLEQDAITRLTDSNMCEHTVYHAMTEKVVTFQKETPLSEICKCLARHEFRRVPIVDSQDKLVGIISRKDIIAVIS